eukprot:3154401-Pleurochrysis_carterae.AAC.4
MLGQEAAARRVAEASPEDNGQIQSSTENPKAPMGKAACEWKHGCRTACCDGIRLAAANRADLLPEPRLLDNRTQGPHLGKASLRKALLEVGTKLRRSSFVVGHVLQRLRPGRRPGVKAAQWTEESTLSQPAAVIRPKT